MLFHSELSTFNKVRKQFFKFLKVKNIRRSNEFIFVEFESITPTQAFVLGQMFQDRNK